MGIKSYPVIDMIATGKNIVHLRQAQGLSVAEVQEYFGFDAPQAIYKWQQGKSLPSTDNLVALSHLLEVSLEDLLVIKFPGLRVLPQEESCGNHFFWNAFIAGASRWHFFECPISPLRIGRLLCIIKKDAEAFAFGILFQVFGGRFDIGLISNSFVCTKDCSSYHEANSITIKSRLRRSGCLCAVTCSSVLSM